MDGSRIAFISGANAKIIDAASGEVRRTLRGHDGGIHNIAFTRGGALLVTAGGDRIKHWDATLDERVAVLKDRATGPRMWATKPSPDGSRLVRADGAGFWVWGPGEKPIFAHPPRQPEAALPAPKSEPPMANRSPPLVAGVTGPPPTEDAEGNKFGGALAMGLGQTAINPNGTRVAWWNQNGYDNNDGKLRWHSTLQLWDPDGGRLLVDLSRAGHLTMAAFSPDGRRLAAVFEPGPQGREPASVSEAGGVKVWDALTGRELFNLPVPKGGDFALGFSTDESRLGVVGSDGNSITVGLWDPEDGRALPTANLPLGAGWGWRDLRSTPPAISAGGKRIAIPLQSDIGPGLSSTIVRVWDAETGSRAIDLQGFKTVAPRFLTFSPEGRRLVTATHDKVIQIWNPDTGDELLRLPAPGEVFHLAFNPDGHGIRLVVRTAAGFEARRLDGSPRPGMRTP